MLNNYETAYYIFVVRNLFSPTYSHNGNSVQEIIT